MTTNEVGHATYRARHWASAYVAYLAGLLLTVYLYDGDPLGMHDRDLSTVLFVGVPLVMPVIALLIFRGGYRVVALGLGLAAPTLWLSFLVFIFVGGPLFW